MDKSCESIMSCDLGGKGSESELRAWLKRIKCSCTTGFVGSMFREARRQRRARRYFSAVQDQLLHFMLIGIVG